MKSLEKILIIGPGYPYRSGQSIFLSSLCLKLSKTYNVELVNYTLLYPKILFPGTTQYDVSKDRKINFPNKRLLNSINPISWWKTAQYINNYNPDLIAFDWWHPFFAISNKGVEFFLNKHLKKRIIYITENVISHEDNKLDKVLTKWGLGKSRAFLALSKSVEQHLNTLFNKRVFLSTLPIYDFYSKSNEDKSLQKYFNINKEDIVFLFFGLVRKYKGLDLLIKAFALIIDKKPKVKLIIAGEFYDDEQQYIDLIHELELNNYIAIENSFIPEEQVHKYFEICDVVVLPYRSATQSGILSMAYGFKKPVIVTNVGELGNLVEDNKTGLIVSEANSKAISNKLLEFIDMTSSNVDFESNIKMYLNKIDEFGKINSVFADILKFVKKESH